MEKSTKIIIAVLILALIILGVFIVTSKNDTEQVGNDNNNISQSNEVKDAVNWIKNEVNNTEKTENEDKVENVINNNEEKLDDETDNNNKTDEKPSSEEINNQKAIDMVKNDWGEDSSVTFKIDEQTEDGKYVICVVDKNTTKVLVWYDVDIKNNTIQEK